MTQILSHTRDGVDALVAAVSTTLTEPERTAYLTLGELTAWSRILRWRRVELLSAPTLLPLLAGTILRTNREPVLLAGMAGGWVGTLAKLKGPETTPVMGMFGIAANHAAYSAALVAHGARPSRPHRPARRGLGHRCRSRRVEEEAAHRPRDPCRRVRLRNVHACRRPRPPGRQHPRQGPGSRRQPAPGVRGHRPVPGDHPHRRLPAVPGPRRRHGGLQRHRQHAHGGRAHPPLRTEAH
ncbi:hypothetical protein QP028_06010 [Corynebacterium suedekumii]|nr:hypothetical protein QP028_06010 [Corynebacterium suedekumii]